MPFSTIEEENSKKAAKFIYKWRFPTCVIGFVDFAVTMLSVYMTINLLGNMYRSRPDTSQDTTRQILRIVSGVLQIPFHLLSIYHSGRLIGATVQNPKHVSETTLKVICHWWKYNFYSLTLRIVILIYPLILYIGFIIPLIYYIILYGLIPIVRRHVVEIREFIENVLERQAQKDWLQLHRAELAVVANCLSHQTIEELTGSIHEHILEVHSKNVELESKTKKTKSSDNASLDIVFYV